jgi:hypothetical protein
VALLQLQEIADYETHSFANGLPSKACSPNWTTAPQGQPRPGAYRKPRSNKTKPITATTPCTTMVDFGSGRNLS